MSKQFEHLPGTEHVRKILKEAKKNLKSTVLELPIYFIGFLILKFDKF